MEGYIYQKVNHSKKYVDHSTGANTKGIERAWLQAKDLHKRESGSRVYLRRNLGEAA